MLNELAETVQPRGEHLSVGVEPPHRPGEGAAGEAASARASSLDALDDLGFFEDMTGHRRQ